MRVIGRQERQRHTRKLYRVTKRVTREDGSTVMRRHYVMVHRIVALRVVLVTND